MKNLRLNLILILIALFLVNCSDSSEVSVAEEYINDQKELVSSSENDLEVEKLGNFLENSIDEGNVEDYISKLDLDYFLNKSTHNIGLSSAKKNGFRDGLETGIAVLPNQLVSKVSAGELYEFISYRYDTSENSYYVLFRFFSEEEGINYHDYKVSKNGDDYYFNDIYIYLTGENMSQTMKRFVMSGFSSNNLMAIFNQSKKRDFNNVIEASKALRNGDYQKAYDFYNSLESEMKTEKFVLIMKAQSAIRVSDEAYYEAMEELKTNYPDDKTLSLNYIDYYIMQEDYSKTLEMVNNLKKETGDDFLEYIIGNIHYTKEDYSSAMNSYKYIKNNYPNYYTGYFSYMGCLVKMEKYEGVIKELNNLLEIDYTKPELIEYIESDDDFGLNEYDNFIQSKEYKRWK